MRKNLLDKSDKRFIG